MVEKIIVNPSEVRGLGDIVSSKGVNDFTKYHTKLTTTTDTVHGTTQNIYKQECTIIYTDINNSTSASTGYNAGRGTVTTDGDDKVFTRSL